MDEILPFRSNLKQSLVNLWHSARLSLIFVGGLLGTIVVLSIPTIQQPSTYLLEVGDVAQQDILAPYALSFESQVLTQQARDSAANAVPEIYDPPDSSIARRQLEELRAALDFISAVRADTFSTEEQKVRDLMALEGISLSPSTAQSLLGLSGPRWEAVRSESLAVLEQVMRNEIREGRVEEARRGLPTLVSMSLPETQASLVVTLVRAFIAPNAMFNEEATQEARMEARAAVEPVTRSYAEGETIIRRGLVVTPLHLEALEAYGMLTPPDRWQDVAIRILLVTVLGSTLVLFAYRVYPAEVKNVRIAVTVSAIMVLTVLGMQFAIPGRTVLPYIFPTATFPLLMAILLGPGMGVMVAFVTGALAGFLATRGLEISLYFILSGTMAALMIGKAERLGTFVWAGLAADLAAVAVVVIFRFPDPATDTFGKASLLGAAIVSGLLSASLGFGLLLLIGNLLGITTNLQLIELSRPDHPLLQMLLRNAPGSYQHSLQVANLAEQAARSIGANHLLVRVGALYHDVGKALRPQFYIENQIGEKNIHEQLDPTTSASMILMHIHEGLELARKYRLPPQVAAFIPEHHGTMETSYQYHAALEAAGENRERVDRKDFTYPGPRPRSRETALLMLADGVEAKARAETPDNEQEIEELVKWVIDDRLGRGQLARTDLTLKDLDTIRRSFVSTLKSIYHPRLRYPELEQSDEAEALPAPTPTRQTEGA